MNETRPCGPQSVLRRMKTARVQCALLIGTLQNLIPMYIPTDREPIHPGKMFRAEFLEPIGISQPYKKT